MAKIDYDLLYLCTEDARAKLKSFSRILHKTPQRLKYNLTRFSQDAIIARPYCVFDYAYFGLILFRVYFKGAYVQEDDKSKIIAALGNNPYVVSIYELSGEYDLVIELEAPNASRFNKEFKKITYNFPTLTNYKITLNLVSHLYPRTYLMKSSLAIPPEIIVGGDRPVVQFKNEELALLRGLLEHPKAHVTSLAQTADMNSKTATLMIKDLGERKIIKGFKYVLHAEKIGVSRFRLFLSLHNLSQEREGQLMQFLSGTKGAVVVHKTVGDWDMEVDIEAFDRAAIRQFTVSLRSSFKDIIQTFNIMEFFEQYRISYLPKCLFDEQPNMEIKKQ